MSSEDDADDEGGRTPAPESNAGVIQQGPCTGASCNGRKPLSAGCEKDAVAIDTVRFPERTYGKSGKVASTGGEVVLYRSPSCGATWARVHRDDAYYSTAWVESQDRAGVRESLRDGAMFVWDSAMFHPEGRPVRACVEAIACKRYCDFARSATYCTDYH